jgi:hypothetical protein
MRYRTKKPTKTSNSSLSSCLMSCWERRWGRWQDYPWPSQRWSAAHAVQDVVRLDEIASPGGICVVRKEGAPVLATVIPAKDLHVFLDRPLCELDAQLEQLATDALCAPEAIAPRGRVTSHLERFPVRMTRRVWSGRADAGSHWFAGLLDPRTTGYTSADVSWSTGLFQIHPGAQK